MRADRPNEPRTRRAVGLREAPTFSVVVTSTGDAGTLRTQLAALLAVCARVEAEVLVVRSGPPGEAPAVARDHPSVRFLRPPAATDPGSLRAAGMAAASGDVVMLTADDDPAAAARLQHLLRVYAPEGGARDTVPEESPAPADGEPRDDGPVRRQEATPIEPPDTNAWSPPSSPAGRCAGSPRATGSSSSAPVPAA